MMRSGLSSPELTLGRKLISINWFLILLIGLVAGVGFAMLYSAADGNMQPWAERQMLRFGVAVAVMIVVATINIRIWLRYAYVLYFVALALLVAVEVAGYVGMGAQRWLSLGFVNIQPSELMKIFLVLALARYFNAGAIEDIGSITRLIVPIALIAAPTVLILRQPDLGTAIMVAMTGGAVLFLAGVRLWKFAVVGIGALAAAPIAWQFLHEYQKKRVLTFLNPETDPLGAGYHIIQSKIALGSGGLMGKGFMLGPQSHLHFLPEMQTDFIFTMLAEEFGLVGGLALIVLYALIVTYGIVIAIKSRNQFGRLVAGGITTTFFLYVFINIAMVTGLIPVVGVPLPLVSYGGTVMLTLMIGFGLVIGVGVHRDVPVGRRGEAEGL
ncbi:MAG: rod shape-determining protein RodA [Rhodospirillales bacterium]|nr:rod shape-determining protein RodA [Rhodospirillales bacterium]MBO6787168.1 rod shape-determining protein RodA [Rhodospirillales bacterium]